MRLFNNKKFNFKSWLPPFVFAAAVIVFYKVIDWFPTLLAYCGKFISVLTPFIIGFVIAFILTPCAARIESFFQSRKNKLIVKTARPFSILITYIFFLFIVAMLIYFIIPTLVQSIIDLIDKMPGYYDEAMEMLEKFTKHYGNSLGISADTIKENISLKQVLKFFDLSSIDKYAQGVIKFGSAVVEIVISLIISVYMLASRETLIHVVGRFLTLFMSRKKIHSAKCYLSKIADIFYKYIYSQLLDAFIVATLMTITFVIIGVPYPLLSGILIGICNLIPYFGATISGAVVAIFTLIANGFGSAILALVLIIVIQQIDANIIQPRIVGGSVGIKPIYVLLAITVGGGLFGFIGILVCVPVIATLKMILNDIIDMKDAGRLKKQSMKV